MIQDELIKALEYYANEDNYDENGAPFTMEESHECVHEFISLDLGGKAREALLQLCNANINNRVISANHSRADNLDSEKSGENEEKSVTS